MLEDGRLVILAQNSSRGGCDFYRVVQPMAKIMDKDLFPVALSTMLEPNDVDVWIDKADIIFTQMGKSEKLLEYMIFCKENKIKKKFVLDYDDDIFSVSPFNPSYFWHGTREFYVDQENGERTYFKDGENGFNIRENKNRLINFGKCIQMADIVTTPSPVLSGKFKKLNKNTRVIKNFVNLDVWNPLPLIKDEKVRIVYQGGWSQFEDWYDMADILKVIMSKYPQVHLVLMGATYEGHLKGLPQDRIQRVPWTNPETYPHIFKGLNSDIGICPLANTEFNTCKSELKWEEYSALEIATVAQNIPPYSLNIRDGIDGFVCGSIKDWIETLSKLIEDRELRNVVGRQARKRIIQDYNLDKGVYEYEALFKSMFRPQLITA